MAMPGSGGYRGIGIQHLKYRRKSYGLMLLLAFGAALMGVMVVHKLREKRVYNILLKEKDEELFALQVLLQVHISTVKCCPPIFLLLPCIYYNQKEVHCIP